MAPQVLICYRNPGSYHDQYNDDSGVSHGGLCNNALWTVKMLRAAGIYCTAKQVWGLQDLIAAITPGITNVVIEAQFLTTAELTSLLQQFPNVTFVQRCHSQIAFLATAPNDVTLLREYLPLQDMAHNFQVASNSEPFSKWVEGAYRQDCLYLPNAYVLARPGASYQSPKINKDTLVIGCFGAVRLLKNQATAAAAALWLARTLNKRLEFHMNANRVEHGPGVLTAIKALFADVPWATLVLDPWTDWGTFRQLASTMDLCFQLSSTETFNLVTADACADGVASVVGDAIPFTPPSWCASIDQPTDAGRVGIELLTNPMAVYEGQTALSRYCKHALERWQEWLNEPGV